MIRSYYTGRTLLVTGGTGFVGSALIAKVLGDLGEEVRRVYVLIRPRRRKDGGQVAPDERLAQLFETSLFAPLRADEARWQQIQAKVVPVSIDERRDDLGLTVDDRRRLVGEVDTIFNSAATVVFDEPLDVSLQANVRGPQALLEIAHAAEAEHGRQVDFVHVSTAYVNGQRTGAIADQPLPTDHDMRQLIDGTLGTFDPEAEVESCAAFCEQVRQEATSDEFVRGLKRDILKEYPRSGKRRMTRTRLEGLVDDRRNRWIERRLVDEGMRRGRERGWTDVYTFTKAMGEQLLELRAGSVPLVIVRPSIIESSLSDPEPGWITGLKVMDPLLAAYGRGLIPDFPASPGVILDVIPVDLVVNGCLAAATQANRERVEVYHIATGGENPIRIREVFDSVRAHFARTPMTDMDDGPPELHDWSYPSLRIFRTVFHLKYLLPLRVREWLMLNTPGRTPSPRQKRMMRSQRVRLQRVLYYIDIYSPYTHLDCCFQTGRTRALFESMPAVEQDRFSLDVTRIDWPRYIEDIHLPGMRRHVLRDEIVGEAVLPEAPEEPGHEEALLQDEEELRTIPDLMRSACARHGDAIALELVDSAGIVRQQLSYADLIKRTEQRCASWQSQGLGVGDRILIAGDNGPDWVLNYMAASFLGATVVPVDVQTGADELRRMADYVTAAAIVVATDRHQDLLSAGWSGPLIEWVASSPAGASSAAFVEPQIDAETDASIIFTCGVRVDPRAVVLTHDNFVSCLIGLNEVMRLEAQDRLLSLLPLHHGLEFTGGLLMSLWSGATTSYVDGPFHSRRIVDTIRRRGVTALLTVPRILKILVDRARRLDGDTPGPTSQVLSDLRLVVSGGAPLPETLFDTCAALGISVHEGYGLTEAAPIVSVCPPGASRRGSVGLPLPCLQVRIDGDGEDGEILVQGPTVMKQYLHRPDLTESILRDGWLHTGDIGRIDQDGYLYITGRQRELIVTGAGKNVYPVEVEELYADLPYTAELAVVGLPSERTMGEEVHAVAALTPEGRQLDRDEVERRIRDRVYDISRDLPAYQRISRVHVWSRSLPRLDDGRVDREVLRQDLRRGDDASRQVDTGDALAPWERRVYARVSQLSGLSLAEIVAHADAPLDSVINSLMAAELAVAFDTDRPVQLDRSETTLRQLLDHLGSGVQLESPSESYWSDALSGHPSMGSSRRASVPRFWKRLRSRRGGVRVHGELPTDERYVLAASGVAVESIGAVADELMRQVQGLTLLLERHEDVPPGLPGTVELVVLQDFATLEEGLQAAASKMAPRWPVVLFPEGLRGTTGRGSGAFKSGVGLLSRELKVPVVPLAGAGPMAVRIGVAIRPEPFEARTKQLAPYEIYREIAAAVRQSIRELSEEG